PARARVDPPKKTPAAPPPGGPRHGSGGPPPPITRYSFALSRPGRSPSSMVRPRSFRPPRRASAHAAAAPRFQRWTWRPAGHHRCASPSSERGGANSALEHAVDALELLECLRKRALHLRLVGARGVAALALDRKKLAAFSALGDGFLRFPIGDRRCNRTRASVGNAGGNARPSLTNGRIFGPRRWISAVPDWR